MARSHLGERISAKKDLIQCIRLDPKNKDAREALTAIEVKEKAGRDLLGEAYRKGMHLDPEEQLMTDWRAECDRLRAERGTQQQGVYDLAPISLEDFKRQREAREEREEASKQAAQAAVAARNAAASKEAREAARLDGVDLESMDNLREALRDEGVDVDNVAALTEALRVKGVDSQDRRELEELAREYAAAKLAKPSPAPSAIEDITTESMYTMSSWR